MPSDHLEKSYIPLDSCLVPPLFFHRTISINLVSDGGGFGHETFNISTTTLPLRQMHFEDAFFLDAFLLDAYVHELYHIHVSFIFFLKIIRNSIITPVHIEMRTFPFQLQTQNKQQKHVVDFDAVILFKFALLLCVAHFAFSFRSQFHYMYELTSLQHLK